MKRWLIIGAVAIGSVALLALGGTYGASLYYAAGHGSACADCHEMSAHVNAIHSSPHRNAGCTDCHEASHRHQAAPCAGASLRAPRKRFICARPICSR